MVTPSNGVTKVRTARRSTGGVAIRLMSRTPVRASCRVRGIGVAVSVSTWTSARSSFSRSLWLDAEMLLLVDDQQAEILELDALGQQRMGADDDVDRALLQRRLGLLGLLGRHQARQPADPDRQALEALDEVAVMLARQQGRRADHRDLLARHRRDEGRAQRDLGLAEADIAADQPVHRLARGQVVQHVGDRLQLVVGLGIGEAGAELLVEAFLRAHRLAAPHRALGGDGDQPVGHVGDALLQPRLARLPGDAAQAVERGVLVRRAVAAQHVDVLDRHEQLVAALVGELAGSRGARAGSRA